MIKEKTILKEHTVRQKYCDVCETQIPKGLACWRAHCEYCGKDLCDKCIGHEEETGGDYRIVYCKTCWEIGDEYRPLILELDIKISNLYKEWQTKCKKQKQKL